MSALLGRLGRSAQRGSKPRCHILTQGEPTTVAARLTALTTLPGSNDPLAIVSANDAWMPQGFEALEEAELHKAPRLVPSTVGEILRQWWLPQGSARSRSPNFDIASTCTFEGRTGLILVEAKAHAGELDGEARAKPLSATASPASRINHASICDAITEARTGLQVATGVEWSISRDIHYQMSNRFSWAWKLAALGFPVVLIYLGFLNARDMTRGAETPFNDAASWDAAVRQHSAPLFPERMWNTVLRVGGVPLAPLIASMELPLQEMAAA